VAVHPAAVQAAPDPVAPKGKSDRGQAYEPPPPYKTGAASARIKVRRRYLLLLLHLPCL